MMNKMKGIRKILISAALITLMSSCYYDTEQVLYPAAVSCDGAAASFSVDVAPLIQSRCATAGCHAAGSSNSGGPLTSYSQIKYMAASIRSSVITGIMPQGSTLSSNEIKTIICWIDNGSANN